MKVAVTGASGHVGNVLCRRLCERGHSVRALVYRETRSLEGLDIERVQGSLFDQDALDRLMDGADTVCHSAALISIGQAPEAEVYRTNVDGTRNMLEAARRQGLKRYYQISSIHAHLSPGLDGRMDEKTAYVDPKSAAAYDRSKAAAEKAVIAARTDSFSTTIFNPTAVIGPFDFKPGLSGQMILRLATGKIPMLTPLGYDWVDVRDVAEAICTAMEQGVENEKFMLSGRYGPVKEVAAIIAKHSGVAAPKFTAPFWLARIGVPFITLQSKMTGQEPLYTHESLDAIAESCRNISSRRAENALGYRPRDLEASLTDAVAWFTQNGYIS